jgi:hypothetical protein
MGGFVIAAGSIGLSIFLCRTLNRVVLGALMNSSRR